MYVLADLEATIADAKISGRLTNLAVNGGPRPKKAADFGADEAQLNLINNRIDGVCKTRVRLGTGIAMVMNGLASLDWAGNLERIQGKFGMLGPEVLLGPFRDFSVPRGTFGVADLAAGVLEEEDWLAGCVREMVEIGLFDESGWSEFVLLDNLAPYQQILKEEQVKEWRILEPEFEREAEMPVSIFGQEGFKSDKLDEKDAILCTLPDQGSLEVILPVRLKVSGDGWRLCDTEHTSDPEPQPLRRNIAVIARRQNRSPVMLFFQGSLDIRSCPVILDGEAIETALNQKTRTVLRALGWI